MKSLLLVLAALAPTAAAAAGRCDATLAAQRGRAVSDKIAAVNEIPALQPFQEATREDASFFYVRTIYDTGLSVPAYTVKIGKSDCFVREVAYANLEG